MSCSYKKTLADICCELIGNDQLGNNAEVVVKSIQIDSRKVKNGDIFLALNGSSIDGGDFIEEAQFSGAAAILLDAESSQAKKDQPSNVIVFPDLRRCAGYMAANYYSNPSRSMNVTGITGTNGKTTIAFMLAWLKQALGEKVGVMGTLGAGVLNKSSSAGKFQPLDDIKHTTPDSLVTQKILSDFLCDGCQSVVLEVSSHALDQHRVNGVEFDVAVFSNLSRDHLDYHGNIEDYAAAKRKLFGFPALKAVVINIDDDCAEKILASVAADVKVIRYSVSGNHADISVVKYHSTASGTCIDLVCFGERLTLTTTYFGGFNVSNILAVIAVLVAGGYTPQQVAAHIRSLPAVPGRMERVVLEGELGQVAHCEVVVDFAHTPDALEQVLIELKQLCRGELWCVFGCGGDRDKGKRALMGAAASRYANHVVITTDNPRSEPVDNIIAEIISGIKKKNTVQVVQDREHAIAFAVAHSSDNDIVLIAGKGHEREQIFAEHQIPFNDGQVAQRYLRARYDL